MDRTLRCELLAQLSDQQLTLLAAELDDALLGSVTVITPPTVGMVMARAVEGARGEVFNLGEVLVTECLVTVAGHEGWSMVMGSRPTSALAAATLDAALAAGHPDRDRIEAEVRRLAAEHEAAATEARHELAATRVRFETQ